MSQTSQEANYNKQVVIGIDPGLHGGIGIIDIKTSQAVAVYDSPGDDLTEWKDLQAEIVRQWRVHSIWIEKVGAFPKQGVSSTFRFGEQFGIAKMFAFSITSRVFFVTPVKWKKTILDANVKRKDRAFDKKALSLDFARRYWPELELNKKADDGKAEALLIALYGLHQAKLNQYEGD